MALYLVKSRNNEPVQVVEGLNEGGRVDTGRLPVVAYVVSSLKVTYVVDKDDLVPFRASSIAHSNDNLIEVHDLFWDGENNRFITKTMPVDEFMFDYTLDVNGLVYRRSTCSHCGKHLMRFASDERVFSKVITGVEHNCCDDDLCCMLERDMSS